MARTERYREFDSVGEEPREPGDVGPEVVDDPEIQKIIRSWGVTDPRLLSRDPIPGEKKFAPPDPDDEGVFASLTPEDMGRARSVTDAAKGRSRMPQNPSEPSVPKWKPAFDQLLPMVLSNSPTREDFAENLRRVFEGLKRAGHEVDDIDGLVNQFMEFWKPTPSPMQQNRRDELQKYQDDFEGGR